MLKIISQECLQTTRDDAISFRQVHGSLSGSLVLVAPSKALVLLCHQPPEDCRSNIFVRTLTKHQGLKNRLTAPLE